MLFIQATIARADIEAEFHIVSQMVNLSDIVEKLKSYIGMLTLMIKSLDKHDTEPNYKNLPTVSLFF